MTEQPLSLAGRTALITGGGSGIGAVVARHCGGAGACVIVAELNLEAGERVAGDLRASGYQAECLAVDVTDEASVKSLFAGAPPIDLLVNCAANLDPAYLAVDLPLTVWEETLRVLLTGTFLCSREALRTMIPHRNGVIVNLSSVAGKMGYPLRAAYAAAKAGVISLTKTLALEAGPHQITVNAICPGPTEGDRMSTVIAQRAEAQGRTAEAVAAEYRSAMPLNQFIQPGDIASLVLFLASPAGARITGQAIDVDAGYLLT